MFFLVSPLFARRTAILSELFRRYLDSLSAAGIAVRRTGRRNTRRPPLALSAFVPLSFPGDEKTIFRRKK